MSLRDPESVLIGKIPTGSQPLISLDFQMRTSQRSGTIATLFSGEFVLSLSLTRGLVRANVEYSRDSKTLQAFSFNQVHVADGRWHQVACNVDAANKELTLSVDGGSQAKARDMRISTNINTEARNVGTFKIGGFVHNQKHFVGCVREIFMNNVLVQPNDRRLVTKSRNIVAGACVMDSVRPNADFTPSNINATEGTPNLQRTSASSAKDDAKSNVSETVRPTAVHSDIAGHDDEIIYMYSKSKETILKVNATGSAGKEKSENPSLAYLIVIATLVSAVVVLLTFVFIVCARLKHCLCFKERCEQLKDRDTTVESSSRGGAMRPLANETQSLVEQSGPTLQVVEPRNTFPGAQSVNDVYFSMNRQQARYWRERDEKLLDSQCRQHMEAERRIVPAPAAQLEQTQSPTRRLPPHASPDVILAVFDDSEPRKKVVTATKGVACGGNTRASAANCAVYKKESKSSHGNAPEAKKSKVMEEMPVKKKKRLGYGWAYGSRFARGADSSDTDCSDIERLSSHSKYRYRYGKNSGTIQTGRPLRILEASETEEEQQSNDEKSSVGRGRKWGRFGKRNKKFGTFAEQRPRVLNVLSEEDRAQDVEKADEPAVGAKLAAALGHQADSPLLPKPFVEKDLTPGRDRRRSQHESGRDAYSALAGASMRTSRGDPDGRPEIPRRLSSLVLPPEDIHGGVCSSRKESAASGNACTLQDYLTFSGITYEPLHSKCTHEVHEQSKPATGQDFGHTRRDVATVGVRKQSVTIGGKPASGPGAARQHVRVSKAMLMHRADNLMSGDRPTIV